MKSNLFALILLLVGLFSSSINVCAQELSDWEWEQYGVVFSAPDGFKIDECTDRELSGSVDGIRLNVVPFSDMGVSEDILDDYTIQMATDFDFQDLSDTEELELEGFSGSYISGTRNGEPALLMVLLGDEESNNFIVTISYPAAEKATAINILESFSKTELEDAAEEGGEEVE